ncbi:MAG: sigma-E processing peptidase SpoIIGA [Bacilli bacterium]|nr:sigma-E processing peptidase SpoIIGA [Bacilli bacterium]
MTIYLDLIAILNFGMDFILLFTVNNTLKRNTKLRRMIFGGLFGSLTLIFLFLPLHSFALFFLKIIVSFLMCIITFQFKNWRYTIENMIYFYMSGTILGGFLYYLNLEFSYKHEGIVFFHHGLSINFIFLIIISPIILYIYIRSQKKLKTHYQHYYKLNILFKNNQTITVNAFLDTGNKLMDPVTKKGIILVEEKSLRKIKMPHVIYVPYHSLNNHGLLKCIAPKSVTLDGVSSKNYLIGISEKKFQINGIECILNSKCLEDLPC